MPTETLHTIPSRPLNRYPGDTAREVIEPVIDRDNQVLRAGTIVQPQSHGWDQAAGCHYTAVRVPGEDCDRVVLHARDLSAWVWIVCGDISPSRATVLQIHDRPEAARQVMRPGLLLEPVLRTAAPKVGDRIWRTA